MTKTKNETKNIKKPIWFGFLELTPKIQKKVDELLDNCGDSYTLGLWKREREDNIKEYNELNKEHEKLKLERPKEKEKVKIYDKFNIKQNLKKEKFELECLTEALQQFDPEIHEGFGVVQ